MNYRSSQTFITHLRQVLNGPQPEIKSEPFLRLDQVREISPAALEADSSAIPPPDPVADAYHLIVSQLKYLNIDNVILGINELMKNYLKNINPANQQLLTEKTMDRMLLFFLLATEENHPFSEKLWECLSACAKPVGLFLMDQNLSEAFSLYIQFMGTIGKRAARKNLSTGSLQHVLRVLEARTAQKPWKEACFQIKNLRQNLES